MRKRLRIFISSPGDVNEERLRAHLVIQKLARDYARFFAIEAYLWEHEPMLASGHFQDAIDPPSATDVVILIVYARLGTALPERTAVREYRGIDGRAPVTGTEWEFEDALAAHRARGAPDLLAYRKSGDPGLSLTDPARRAEQERQWQGLEAFWRRHFEDAGMFLAGSSRFASVEEFDKKLESDLTALIELRITQDLAGTATEPTTWLKGSPFRGLAAYDFDDADIFFGRDGQTRLALTRLQAAADDGCAFLMLLGASGSGKSSLARAGILPALFVPKAIPGVGIWRRVVFRPGDGGDDPIRRFAQALASGDTTQGIGLPEMLSSGANVDALATHLAASADDPSFPFQLALDRVANNAIAAKKLLPHESARLVLLVDQIEELFTRGIDPQRRDQFLRILSALARSGVAWVVATMRSDLWHRVAEAKPLLDLVESGARVDLVRPDGAEIIEIIRRPAAAAGLKFDIDTDAGVALDAVIARAASEEPGALPLLSVLLDTMYERDIATPRVGHTDPHTLTFETYKELGELKGAIAQRADDALARLREHDPEAAAALPRVLRNLVTVSQSGDAITARPARLDAFPEGGPEARMIAAFTAPDARLLVASARADGAEVRLAHESLLENWPAARAQVQNDRRDLETRARIEALHRRWRDAPAAAERKRALLSGLNLAEGSDLVTRWSIDRDGELGAYVRASARAERMRRGRFIGIAAALVLVFAAIAGFAGIESRRAEREADAARTSEQAERAAREAAVEQRTEAVRQRDRADASRREAEDSERKAVAALRATRRQSARTLSAQAEVAASRQEFRQALTFAVSAGETEREALDPGDTSASEPALLRAMANLRQVMHVRRPEAGPHMLYAFAGDTRLVHATRTGGIVITDVASDPKVVARAPLPQGMNPFRMATLRAADLIAVSGDTRLTLVDERDGSPRGAFSLPSLITSIDAHEGKRRIVLSTASSFAVLDVDTGSLSEPISVEVGDTAIGQVRFSRDGDRVWLAIGAKVRAYDLSSRRFVDGQQAELDASESGIDKPLLDSLLAKGLITVVEVAPDLTRDRVLLWHSGRVRALDAQNNTRPFDREDNALRVLGVSFVDSARSGAVKEAVAVLARPNGETGEELELRFISDDPKMLAFERFSIAADDATADKMVTCKVSLHASHLACHYWTKQREGLVVYKLLGGAHRFHRVFGRTEPAWAELVDGDTSVLVGNAAGVHRVTDGALAKLGDLPQGWKGVALAGRYLVAASQPAAEVGVWRVEADPPRIAPVIAPLKAKHHAISRAAERVVFAENDRLAIYDLKDGRRIGVVPGLDGLRGVALSEDGARVGALTDTTAYVFSGETGRLQASVPVTSKDTAFAFDPAVRTLAFIGPQSSLRVIGLASGEERVWRESAPPAALLAWSPDGQKLILGRRDGGAEALDPSGKALWDIPSPLGSGFSELNSWPEQPPKGMMRSLAFSPDGAHIAFTRQDMPAIDLHDATTGRYLTGVSTPWTWGVPARVALGPNGRVLSTWAVHPMALDQPLHVALHALPLGLEAALAAAKERLERIETILDPALTPIPR